MLFYFLFSSHFPEVYCENKVYKNPIILFAIPHKTTNIGNNI